MINRKLKQPQVQPTEEAKSALFTEGVIKSPLHTKNGSESTKKKRKWGEKTQNGATKLRMFKDRRTACQ